MVGTKRVPYLSVISSCWKDNSSRVGRNRARAGKWCAREYLATHRMLECVIVEIRMAVSSIDLVHQWLSSWLDVFFYQATCCRVEASLGSSVWPGEVLLTRLLTHPISRSGVECRVHGKRADPRSLNQRQLHYPTVIRIGPLLRPVMLARYYVCIPLTGTAWLSILA